MSAYGFFIRFKSYVEKQIGCVLKCLKCDNAKELLSLTKFLHSNGINHRLTCPHTHEHNPLRENTNM